MKLYLLGAPTIEIDGKAFALPRRKSLALLVYLAVTGKHHRRENLATLLWPESDQRRSYAYLRNAVWEINKTIGEGWIESNREIVGLNPSADVQTDIQVFRQYRTALETHGHPKNEVCSVCLPPLRKVDKTYRGTFLEGFGLHDSPNFDDWQFYQEDELCREFADSLQKLVLGLEAEGLFEEAIRYAKRWLDLDHISEIAHRHLMQLYAWSGRRNAALRQYQECERILADELGVLPEPETTKLSEKIRTSAVTSFSQPSSIIETSHPQSFTQTPRRLQVSSLGLGTGTISELPVQPTPFIGRVTELDEITQLLEDPACRILTLLGPGGIGKTRLAIQAANENRKNFPHGVVFVSLASHQQQVPIIPVLIEVLGLPIQIEVDRLQEQLTNYLREKKILLILDNFEHLIEEANLLAVISARAPQVKIIVTSRQQLNLRGEWVFEIEGMDYPEMSPSSLTDENIEDYSAVKLFSQCARRTEHSFSLEKADYPAVVEITQLVAGTPLGIELAAAWVNVLSCSEIAQEIRRSIDFLKTSLQDVPDRQRSIRAAFEYSWNLLDPKEKDIFPKLSVFEGKFTRKAAGEVTSLSPQVLMALVSKSLLHRSAGGNFELHPLIKQFAAEKLGQNHTTWFDTLDTHSSYYCSALSRWGNDLVGPDQQEALRKIEAAYSNIHVAWIWATDTQQIARLEDAINSMFGFFFRQRRIGEGERVFQTTAAALAQYVDDKSLTTLAKLLAFLTFFAFNRGQFEISQRMLNNSQITIDKVQYDQPQSRFVKGLIRFGKGVISGRYGEMDSAIPLFEESIQIFRELREEWWASEAMSSLSWATNLLGDDERSKALSLESLQLRKKLGDKYGVALHLQFMGIETAFNDGKIAEAEALLQESTELFRELGDPVSQAHTIENLDHIAIMYGRFQEALTYREKKLEKAEDLGDPITKGYTLAQLGEAYHMLGKYNQAEKFGRKAIRFLNDSGQYHRTAFPRWFLGMTLFALEQFEAAKEMFEQSVEIYRELNTKEGGGNALTGLSMVAFVFENPKESWLLLESSFEHLLKIKHFFWLFYAISMMALLLIQQGKVLVAIRLYAMLQREPFVANSLWFDDVFGKQIATASQELPVERVKAVQEEGRKLEFWETARECLKILQNEIID